MTYDVAIVGVGMTPVGEHWETSLRDLALEASQNALKNAHFSPNHIDGLVIANALGGTLSYQNHISALIADYIGLRGIEALRIEAADASGGLAIRQAALMIQSGIAKTVMVLGVEKVTDVVGSRRNTGLASFTDVDYEAAHGSTPTALAALLMRRYMHDYNLPLTVFEGFSINAHANGSKNPLAMFRNTIKRGKFADAPVVATPVNLFDSAPEGDGAAAIILTSTENAHHHADSPIIQLIGSGVGTDTLALHERKDMLFLHAVNLAAGRAFSQAVKNPQDIQVLELHDSYTVLSALQLEAAGFAPRGEGWKLAFDGIIEPAGKLPISTFGGLKARGHALGATGIYQAAEITLQLRHEAADNQIPNAKVGMALNLGGLGGTAVAHVFERID